jgi:L-threonylcarbamoyladenylate synthase
LIDAFSPGPLTVILKKTSSISDLVTAGQGTVAIRIPDNKMTLDLLRMVQFPLAAPSANVFMRLSPTKPSHVYAQLSGAIPYILDGGSCSRGIESTIVGVEQNKIIIYRHGAITKTQLTTMGVEIEEYTGIDGILTPGRFKKHYSPRTKLVLAKNINVAIERYAHQVTGVLTFGSSILPTASFVVRNLSIREDIDEAAFELYNSLYELDEMGLDAILCSYVPNRGVGIGINERLLKAATIIID